MARKEMKTNLDLEGEVISQRNTHDNESHLKISIVIPTLNQGDTIEQTILSIISQEDKNYEIIVMDGGSSDRTSEIIQRYERYITHYESRKDNGQSEAINRGFNIAQGNIFAWINSDDYYLPNAFRTVRSIFATNTDVDIVVGSGEVVTKECEFLKHIEAIPMERENLLGWHNDQWIMQQCCFWTAELWKKSGGVDEDLHLLMDYDLWLRFSKIGRSIAVRNSLAAMRFYKEAKTIALRNRMKEEEAYVYAKNGAFAELRIVVRDLSMRNQELLSAVEKIEKSLLHRVIKRFGGIG